MRRLPCVVVDQSGNQYPCTDPQDSPVIIGRSTPPPPPGTILTDPRTGYIYLAMSIDPVINRGQVRYYLATLRRMKSTITVQRLPSNRMDDPAPIVIVSDIPASLLHTSSYEEPGTDRMGFRIELMTPPTQQGIQDNDRIIFSGQPYRVIGYEPTPVACRIVATTDRR